jgi:DNA-binding MarR family transcriptional regulator
MTEAENHEISPRARLQARRMRSVVHALLSLNRRMTLPQAITFVQVMATEGLTVSALAAFCGVKSHTISKHLRELGPTKRNGEPSLNLIKTIQLPNDDGRERRVVLTEHGATVARHLISLIKHPAPPRIPPLGRR